MGTDGWKKLGEQRDELTDGEIQGGKKERVNGQRCESSTERSVNMNKHDKLIY